MSLQNSYEYADKIRSVDSIFRTVVQQRPMLATFISSPQGQQGNTTEQGSINPVTSTKHERLNDVTSPTDVPLTADYTQGDPSLTVSSTAGLAVGSIFRIKKADRTSGTFKGKVTAIVSNTVVNITVISGSDEDLLTGDTVQLIASPRNENSLAGNINQSQPGTEYNFTQIFRKDYGVSNTSLATAIYGINEDPIGKLLDYHAERKLEEIAYEVNRSIISGVRVERTGAEDGTMGGILEYLENGTNKVNPGAALTKTILNDAVKEAVSNGATKEGMTKMVCHPTQAQVVNSFIQDVRRIPVGDTTAKTAGTFTDQFITDTGVVLDIMTDYNMPEDKIMMIDPSKIEWKALQGREFFDEDSTTKGQDGIVRSVIGEYTLEVKNASQSHFLIEGLSV